MRSDPDTRPLALVPAEPTTRRPGRIREGHVHVYSVHGPFCYRCQHPKRWWAFWEKWIEEEHDEPF